MIVYVESNFLLEVVALQEEHEECLELLTLSREETIRLVLPAFSLAEPIHTIHRRHSEREELQQRLNREMALLSRSASFEERLGEVADVASILDDSRREEQERLDQLLGEAAEIAEIIPLGEQVLKRARHVRAEHRLSPGVAIPRTWRGPRGSVPFGHGTGRLSGLAWSGGLQRSRRALRANKK